MLRRQEEANKFALLADTDISQSEEMSDDFDGISSGDDGISSDDGENVKPREVKKKKKRVKSEPEFSARSSDDESESDMESEPTKAKRRNKLTSVEREVFNKNFLEIDSGASKIKIKEENSAGPSTSKIRKVPFKEDEVIMIDSASDDEVSKRRKILTDEELEKETKEAQQAEAARLKRLKNKTSTLTQMFESQRFSEEMGEEEPLVLDFDKRTQETIKVHSKLVTLLKNHQVEGVKFMYDSCYGSISDKVKTESGCILAHCMGLGKTLQVVTLVHTLIRHPQLNTKRILVLCPKSTIINWHDEFKKWLRGLDPPKLYYFEDGMDMKKKMKRFDEWHNSEQPSVFLMNYELFRILVNFKGNPKNSKTPAQESEVKRFQETIERCLLMPGPDLVVCDEGHVIKNQKTAINKAMIKIHTSRRIILSGTPVQNNLNEYYAMIDWIKPSLLGTVKEFNNRFVTPIRAGQHVDSSKQDIKYMKQRSLVLNRKLSTFVQRREVTVLREFLPNKYEYCISVPLTKIQEELYEYFLRQNPIESGKQLLGDFTAMRKIWTHPKVLQHAYERALKVDAAAEAKKKKLMKKELNENGFVNEEPDDVHDKIEGSTGVKKNWWSDLTTENDLNSLLSSNKLFLLFHILRMCQQRNEKVLVFSGFVSVLNVVEEFMKKINAAFEKKNQQQVDPNAEALGYANFLTSWKNGRDFCRIDGSTPMNARQDMIEKFNDKNVKRMRCFLISAKAGGQGINLIGANRCIILDTSWNPSSDQQNIFRIYRLGQPKTCFVYRLIAIGTMEEKIYSRSVTKQAMSGRVVDKMQIDRHYRMDELQDFYTFTPCDYNQRPPPNMPADDILKELLHKHPGKVFKYHEHESLLENKPEEDLTPEEAKEAWQTYELEESRKAPQDPLLMDPLIPTDLPLSAIDNLLPNLDAHNMTAQNIIKILSSTPQNQKLAQLPSSSLVHKKYVFKAKQALPNSAGSIAAKTQGSFKSPQINPLQNIADGRIVQNKITSAVSNQPGSSQKRPLEVTKLKTV